VVALKERITNEMKAALLSGDRFVGETLRNLKAAILNEEVASGKRDEGLADAEIENASKARRSIAITTVQSSLSQRKKRRKFSNNICLNN
jgi:uncharacterized protein YqeY